MIRKLVKIILFLALTTGMLAIISYVMRPFGGAFLHINAYRMEKEDTIDVVYFGGSSCFTYWAPMEAWAEYGFTSFNFANNSMPAQLEKYCIIEALKRQSPQLIVVDVRPFDGGEDIDPQTGIMNMFREATIRNFTDCFRYSTNRFSMIQNGVPKEQEPIYYHFDLAKYHTNYTALLSASNWKNALNIPIDLTKNYGGFDLYTLYSPIPIADYSSVMEELPLSDTLDAIYFDLIEYCKSIDTNVLFVVPPFGVPASYVRKYNYMQRIAEENGIAFLNCNNIFAEIGLDPETDFYNTTHVQIFGAKKYTKWLGAYLQKTYDLPDRRTSKDYQDWQTAYELWLPAATQTEKDVLALMPEDVQKKLLEANHE